MESEPFGQKILCAGYCRRVWLKMTATLLAVRLACFLVVPWTQIPFLGIVYVVVIWIPILLICATSEERLLSHLKIHHRKKWEAVTQVPFKGPGGRNTYRFLSWLDSSDDLNDPVLAAMMANTSAMVRLLMIIFCTSVVVLPLLII